MIEEFNTANSLLSAALERYLSACSAITKLYDPTNALKGISQEISDLIPSALNSVVSYETKFNRAKAILNQTRNIIPTLVSINTLPPEILTHIFQLVLDDAPCYFQDPYVLKPAPLSYPETVSCVCSRWRQIAINSPILWSQIDIVPSQSYIPSRKVLARAQHFAARADPSPLYIHIVGQTDGSSPDIDTHLNAFCASIATRIRSLNISAYHTFNRVHISALQTCLTKCISGTLNKIVITADCERVLDPLDLTEALHSPSHSDRHLPDISISGCVEDRLRRIKILLLTGVYFHWTSQAYHGLVELHLTPPYTRFSSITQFELMRILNGSPKLRVLHFGLEIVDSLPLNTSHRAISLDDLEILNLRPLGWEQSEILLGLLAPGSRPLQLSVDAPPADYPSLFGDEFVKFMTRSNVQDLYIECASEAYRLLPLLEVYKLLHMLRLQTFSLANFCLHSKDTGDTPSREYQPPSPPLPQLDALHLTSCIVDLDNLRRAVEIVPIQTLKLAGCLTSAEQGAYCPVKEHEVLEAGISPTVKFAPAPWLLKDWDPWN